MARALRVEYEGARYHVMCRGNQGKTIFRSDADADLFIKTLGEMCVRDGVVVHAWCLMGNHYHLLLETPRGNLVSGMKWLQGTFTQRYNARHKLWGHLFQGRYKAKVIDDEDGHYFRAVGDYIHLNPADAGMVGRGCLQEWPWSSYPLYLAPPSKRPDWLHTLALLQACGIPKDTPAGRKAFRAYMDLRHASLLAAERNPADKLAWERMERGWVHGSREFRDRMLECLEESDPEALRHATDADQRRAMGEREAMTCIKSCLDVMGLEVADLCRLKKSDPRKLMLAGHIRYHFPVSAAWVSEVLHLGHYTTVSRAMRFYDEPDRASRELKRKILKFTD